MPSNDFSLNQVQRWLQAVITNPDGIEQGIVSAETAAMIDVTAATVESVILPSSQLSSIERLQIYGRAYFGRLIECLRAQFPATCHAIGEQAFDGLALGYLIQHPSTSYTLGKLGDAFDQYLAVTRPPRDEGLNDDQPDFADFLVDLTKLERTYSEVFDGPGPEQSRSIHPDDFAGISPDQFADCQLVLHPCVRLLQLRFPVHEYATSIRQGTEPDELVARPIQLVVTRRDFIVRRFEVTPHQFQLLNALQTNAAIGDAIGRLLRDETLDRSNLATNLNLWFRQWAAAPLFAELKRSTAFE